jgi:hypothetical protein
MRFPRLFPDFCNFEHHVVTDSQSLARLEGIFRHALNAQILSQTPIGEIEPGLASSPFNILLAQQAYLPGARAPMRIPPHASSEVDIGCLHRFFHIFFPFALTD